MNIKPFDVANLNTQLGNAPRSAELTAFYNYVNTGASKPLQATPDGAYNLYATISAGDKSTHAKALNTFISKVPELQLKVSMAHLSAKQSADNVREHSGTVTQVYSNQVGVNITWRVYLKLTLNARTAQLLRIGVNINLIDNGAGVTKDDQVSWSTQIGQAWSNAFAFERGVGVNKQIWALKFDLNFVDSTFDATKRYDVTVHPAQPDVLATFGQAFLNKAATAGGLAERQQVAEHKDQGTLNLGNWGKGDGQAVVHEFGHMVGCPDEYTLQSFTGGVNGEAYDAAWTQAGYTTDSIMNNPQSSSKIYPRHLTYIRRVFESWQGFTRDSVTTVARTSVQQI
jgi:hypothetical protein